MTTTTTQDLENIFPEELRKTNWNIDHTTGVFLTQFITEQNLNNILEIGTSTGVSTAYLALANPLVTVTTIESNKARLAQARDNHIQLGLKNINYIEGHVPEILNLLPQATYDFLFLDCIKLYYVDVLLYVRDNLPECRFILADNCISHESDLAEFFALANKQKSFTLYQIGSGLGLVEL